MRDQARGEREHRLRQHPRIQVDRLDERGLDGLRDARVVVPQGRANLPRDEVEDAPAVGRLDPGAVCPGDGERRKTARVGDEEPLALVVHRRSIADRDARPRSCEQPRVPIRGEREYNPGRQCASTTLSVPMARPTLSRIRRRPRYGSEVVETRAPRIRELTASGLTWVHVEQPSQLETGELADRFGFHELDVEDILSKRQRPKIDEYPRLPLRRPALPRLRQVDPAAERGRARRLPRPRLPDHTPERRAPPRLAALQPLRGRPRAGGRGLLEGVGLPALPRPRRSLRLLLPDSRQDRAQARRDRGRDVRGARARRSSATSRTRSRRSSPTGRSSSRSAPPCACSSGTRSASCRRISSSTSTTSSTLPSGSGTCSTTTRRSSRGSSRRTSP